MTFNLFLLYSTALTDKQPCSFRGAFLLHKQISRIDSCTECICYNGTTTCRVESCPSDPGCENSERIFSPTECCPRCPGVQSKSSRQNKVLRIVNIFTIFVMLYGLQLYNHVYTNGILKWCSSHKFKLDFLPDHSFNNTLS